MYQSFDHQCPLNRTRIRSGRRFSIRQTSSVTYPAIWRCGVSYGRCGCKCGGCASLKEMIHLQWETTASPERDAASPEGGLLASPNFGICDTTPTDCTNHLLDTPLNFEIGYFYFNSMRAM
jgi:hypothetical protein